VKIGTIKKLIVEDYPATARDVVVRLATTLNPFLDQASTAFGNNITIRENLKSKVYALDLPAGTATISLSWDLNERPTSVVIAQLIKHDLSAPSAAFSLSWRYDNKQLALTFIGLDVATRYTAIIVGNV
jgi:hypothetical protein